MLLLLFLMAALFSLLVQWAGAADAVDCVRGLWRGLWRWGGTTAATAGRGAAAATAAPARRWRWLRCAAAAAVRRAAAVLIPRPLPGRNAGACKNGAVLRATCVGHTASTMGEVLRQVRALSSSGQFVPPPHVRVRASDMSIFVVWLDMDRTRPFV